MYLGLVLGRVSGLPVIYLRFLEAFLAILNVWIVRLKLQLEGNQSQIG